MPRSSPRCRECLDRTDTLVDGHYVVYFHPGVGQTGWPRLFFEIEGLDRRHALAGAARRGSAVVNRIVVAMVVVAAGVLPVCLADVEVPERMELPRRPDRPRESTTPSILGPYPHAGLRSNCGRGRVCRPPSGRRRGSYFGKPGVGTRHHSSALWSERRGGALPVSRRKAVLRRLRGKVEWRHEGGRGDADRPGAVDRGPSTSAPVCGCSAPARDQAGSCLPLGHVPQEGPGSA